MLAENLFGDILSDEMAMITGSLGHAAERESGGERDGPWPVRAF